MRFLQILGKKSIVFMFFIRFFIEFIIFIPNLTSKVTIFFLCRDLPWQVSTRFIIFPTCFIAFRCRFAKKTTRFVIFPTCFIAFRCRFTKKTTILMCFFSCFMKKYQFSLQKTVTSLNFPLVLLNFSLFYDSFFDFIIILLLHNDVFFILTIKPY